MDTKKFLIRPSQLRKKCRPSMFKFITTRELEPHKGIIGQERALRSLDFGLDMDIPGYNIYLSGPVGTGKTSLARVMLEEKAAAKTVPCDWCYLYNFQNPDSPRAMQLPAGIGREFTRDISSQVDKMIHNIVKAFEGEAFESQKARIMGSLGEETSKMYLSLEEEARDVGYSISQGQSGLSSIPLKNGEALSQEDYMAMSEEEKQDLRNRGFMIQEKLNEAVRQYKEMERNMRIKVKNLEQETVRAVISSFFAFLFEKYRKYEAVVAYLEEMQQDLLDNTELFIKQEDNPAAHFFRNFNRRNSLRRYQVNLFVDNSHLDKAPVIFESNPTFSNLFGQIEYEGEFGVLATDFSKIKPGSIHKANGGYLVLNVIDILRNYYVWDSLKRVLKTRESCVESVARMYGISNSETLQPQPIPVDVKVVLIGEPLYYYLLYTQDEDFQKIFKIKADFDVEMGRTRKSMSEYAHFIASVCERRQLRHFTPQAVAEVVDYGSRMAGEQEKLSTQFNRLVEVIYEADHWAKKDQVPIVDAPHVTKTIREKIYRSSMYEEKIQEAIDKEILLLKTTGTRVGELNGLAVYEMGDYSFGKPVRITAKAFMGERGLVNIEREIRLSGSIHTKGVLTLSGYMGAQYAQDKPLSLSASLTFEQSYQGIEGDSASSAELYALLSAISGVPIGQGIAVTGSVNQNGEVQPIGGVNQKIEGYYRVCLQKGLDGSQGVIIPRQNLSHLMLSEEVVAAVKNRSFHIWAVEHIDEGIEILSGLPAGQREADGGFPSGSVHYLANKKLEEWNNRSKTGLSGLDRRHRGSTSVSRRRDL
ncbi:MAG TPA: ATP-binding protein [Syntrophomonadaceae bacterium]|nr:ATP-binding protein [Syntrophomonadaceae bacterium]